MLTFLYVNTKTNEAKGREIKLKKEAKQICDWMLYDIRITKSPDDYYIPARLNSRNETKNMCDYFLKVAAIEKIKNIRDIVRAMELYSEIKCTSNIDDWDVLEEAATHMDMLKNYLPALDRPLRLTPDTFVDHCTVEYDDYGTCHASND